jgi:hypothetical protein
MLEVQVADRDHERLRDATEQPGVRRDFAAFDATKMPRGDAKRDRELVLR